MYLLQMEAEFSAALYLLSSDEKYRGMHGHDFNVQVTLSMEELPENGMVYDYKEFEEVLNNEVSSLDNILLNDKTEFIEKNPTVENIAKYIFDKLNDSLKDLPLLEVKVSQNRGFSSVYRPSL